MLGSHSERRAGVAGECGHASGATVASSRRTEARNDHANGFKEKRFQTRLGPLNLRVPQVRGSENGFYPLSLEKGLCSKRALKVALAEMYVPGVSTPPTGRGYLVAHITEQLYGFSVTSSQVSRAAAELDTILSDWCNRPLGETLYLILDARYESEASCLPPAGSGYPVSAVLMEISEEWQADKAYLTFVM